MDKIAAQRDPRQRPWTEFLRSERDHILASSRVAVQKRPVARSLDGSTFLDDAPQLLGRITARLEEEEAGRSVPSSGPDEDVQAVERLDEGADLEAVVGGLAVLRECILDRWEAAGRGEVGASMLNRAIDEVVGGSVRRHVRARARTLTALDRISAGAVTASDRDTVLRSLTRVIVETTEAIDSVAVFLREGERFQLHAAAGLEEALPADLSTKADEGAVEAIAAGRTALELREGSKSPLVTGVLRANGALAFYGVPMLRGEEVVGVAHMASCTALEFSHEDKVLFRAMVERATLLVLQAELATRERAARESLALVDALFASAPVGLAFLDPQLRYVRVNEALAAANSRPLEAHLGRTVREVLPNAADRLEPLFRRPLETGEPLLGIERADEQPGVAGSRHWLTNYFPVRTSTGEIIGGGVALMEITQQKEVERALRESDDRHRQAAEAAGFCLWDWDLRVRTITWSPDHARIFGEARGEVTETYAAFEQHLHVDDRDLVRSRFREARRAGTDFSVEFRVVWPGGSVHHIAGQGQFICDECGSLTRMLGVVVDATDQKLAKEERDRLTHELETERRRLAGIVERLPVGVLLAEAPDGRLVLGNKELERVWRHAFIPSENISCYREYRGFHLNGRPYAPEEWPISRTMLTGEIVAGEEIRILRGDCTWGWMSVNAAPIRDETGKIINGVVTVQDITARKRTEERLALLAGLTKTLTASLDVGAIFQRLARMVVPGVSDLCFVDVRDEGGDITRLAAVHRDPESLDSIRDIARRFPVDPEAPTGVARVLRTGEPLFAPCVDDGLLSQLGATPDHQAALRECGVTSVISVPIVAREVILGALTLAMTTADRRFDEDDFELAQEIAARSAVAIDNARLYQCAQEAIRARDELWRVASHELRNPLASLALQLQAALRATAGEAAGAVTARLHAAERQVRRLAELINELLDTTRASTGRLELNLELVDLSALSHDVEERCRPEAQQAQSPIEVRADQGVIGRWDRSRLDQVVTNLISNAIKYGRGHPIVLTVEQQNGIARVAVQDRGIGISKGDQERIFEPFERTQEARQKTGLGLGLYIVRQIVERHGGTVAVESAPGVGSLFTVELPLSLVASRPSARGSAS